MLPLSPRRGGPIGNFNIRDATIVHVDDPIPEAEDSVVMGHDNHRPVWLQSHAAQQLHHRLTRMSIQCGGRFITDQQPGFVDQGSSDRNPLLLSSGKLIGHQMHSFFQADGSQNVLCGLKCLFARGSGNDQRDRRILDGRQRRQKIVLLENESDIFLTETDQFRAGHRDDVLTQDR